VKKLRAALSFPLARPFQSLPGSSLLPLLAGSVFGLFWGTMLVSVTSTIAATLEFLAARYLLRDAIQTPIKKLTYIGISLVGLLASTAVYVNASTELGRLDSLSSLLSPGLIVSFTMLGFFPLVAKKLLNLVYSYRVSRGF
jgi:uncharacterized membrane protein YdjX (TVP38/TMEM64 family)